VFPEALKGFSCFNEILAAISAGWNIERLEFSVIEEHEIMKMNTRTIGDIQILDWSGKITLGEGTMSVRNAVRDILQAGGKKIILNLSDVSYIDSSGIGELVSSYTTVTNCGGHLKLLNLTKKIHELLAITKLLTVFETFDNEQTALASFK
jgi:anti-sigma B factor antagonist